MILFRRLQDRVAALEKRQHEQDQVILSLVRVSAAIQACNVQITRIADILDRATRPRVPTTMRIRIGPPTKE